MNEKSIEKKNRNSSIINFFTSTFSDNSKKSILDKRKKKKYKKYNIFKDEKKNNPYSYLENKSIQSILDKRKKFKSDITKNKNKNYFNENKQTKSNPFISEFLFNKKNKNVSKKYSLTDESTNSNINVMNVIENLEIENKRLKKELKNLNEKSKEIIFKNKQNNNLKNPILNSKLKLINSDKKKILNFQKKKIYFNLFDKSPRMLVKKVNDTKTYYQNEISKIKNKNKKCIDKKEFNFLNNKFLRKREEFQNLEKKYKEMSYGINEDIKDLLSLKIKENKLKKKLNNNKNYLNIHIS